MNNQSPTERLRKDWDSQADAWFGERDSMLTASRPIHEWLVEHLEPREGQRVLEIAAGPGDTGFLAARRLGKGRLVSTDFAPSMVDVARKRGAELGIQNADYQVLDAQAMTLEDASFDGVICRWGFMLMPDPAAALRECRRILVPGGRLVFAVFTSPDENPWASLPVAILRSLGHLPPPSTEWQPGILALADREKLQALLDGVRFSSTQIEAVDMTWSFADANGYWNFLMEVTALGPVVRSLSATVRDDVRARIDQRIASFTGPTGVALPARCWCGLAIR